MRDTAREAKTNKVMFSYESSYVDRTAKTYIHPLRAEKECSLEDQLGPMDERVGWRERERESGNSLLSVWLDDDDDVGVYLFMGYCGDLKKLSRVVSNSIYFLSAFSYPHTHRKRERERERERERIFSLSALNRRRTVWWRATKLDKYTYGSLRKVLT